MIEVGEYVRVKNGGIGKVIELFGENGIETDNENITKGWDGEGISNTYIQEIAKHSKNIIDLIEVGDFITLCKEGYPVLVTNIGSDNCYVNEEDNKKYMMIELNNCQKIEDIKNDKDFEVYSIVTKEQFKNIEYIVENK